MITPVRPILMAIGVLAAASACTSASVAVERVQWSVSEDASGHQLSLLVYAGGSTCVDYDRVDVDEGGEVVEIRAYLRVDKNSPCSEDLRIEEVAVELTEPLGDRSLVGCAGPDTIWPEWSFGDATDCAAPSSWAKQTLERDSHSPA
ncbi:hypothetical protein [Oceanitalea stevensii]|uniref:Lipoprotein n=1 Tax=Oceanitalea stevensii TaxID=2763072 RepID=A0ABR8Z262_9MICO|nr:hypothetical protein [Oceanitalea stevensii]MBD8062419.1 hypothetical protein [Oceanitalea stevensii]